MSKKDIKVYRVDLTISEYNQNDEGFYSIKENIEVARGPDQLIESLESVYFSTVKYIDKRVNHD